MSAVSEDRQRTPTMLRRQLASELRRLRENAGLTSRQVSEHLFCTPWKISRIETGRVSPNPRDVRDLLELYGVKDQRREELLRLESADQVDRYWAEFERLRAVALAPDESSALLIEMTKKLQPLPRGAPQRP